MPEKAIEYVVRIGPSDGYRHLHIQQRGKVENDLKSNWLFYKQAFMEGLPKSYSRLTNVEVKQAAY